MTAREELRTKYLVGVDEARSAVRNSMGIKQAGDMTDQLWGVIDLVIDTDFPDVRRQCNIGNDFTGGKGGGMIIPQEHVKRGVPY
jgi:phenol 2-monooxygenase